MIAPKQDLQRINMRLTESSQRDLEVVRDWVERATRGGVRINTTDAVTAALRLAAEYVTGQPRNNQG